MIYESNSAPSNTSHRIAPPQNCVDQAVASQYSIRFALSSSTLHKFSSRHFVHYSLNEFSVLNCQCFNP